MAIRVFGQKKIDTIVEWMRQDADRKEQVLHLARTGRGAVLSYMVIRDIFRAPAPVAPVAG